MALIWRKHLSVGNAMLDLEHKSLIGMVNSIEYAIDTKDSSALFGAIKLFKDEIDAHFVNEARFAQAFHFHFEQHNLAHQHFQEEFRQKTVELAAEVGTWFGCALDGYPQFLRDWLIGHIASEDMKMKPVLQSYPYDFNPV